MNYEARSVERFIIVSKDSGTPALSVDLEITVILKDVQEMPRMAVLSNNRVRTWGSHAMARIHKPFKTDLKLI